MGSRPGNTEISTDQGGKNRTYRGTSTLTMGAGTTFTSSGTVNITTGNFTDIDAGASGTAGSVDIFPGTAAKGKLVFICDDQTGDTTVTVKPNEMGQATIVNIPDPGAAASYVVQSTAALTLAEVDVLDGVTPGTISASKAVVVDASRDIATLGNVTLDGILTLDAAGGASAANAVLMGNGTSLDPCTVADADKSFVEFRTQSTATSGSSRGLYWRHDLNGDGQSGESLRTFAKITGLPDTARGAHISLDIDTANSKGISGLGAGTDSQILVGDGAAPAGGTYAVSNLEIFSGGAGSSMENVTDLSYIRVVNAGNQAGKDRMDDKAVIMSFSGFTAGAGHVLDSTIDTTAAQIDHTWAIRWHDGSIKYIPVMDNADGS